MPVREWEEIQEMLWRANDESIIRQAPRSPEGLRIGCRRCLTILSHQRELNLRKTPSRQGENHGVLQYECLCLPTHLVTRLQTGNTWARDTLCPTESAECKNFTEMGSAYEA